MEATKKRVLQFLAFVSCSISLHATITTVAPYLQPRPASRDLAGRNVGSMSHHAHLYGMESYYGYFDVRFKYGQTFRPKRISQLLFDGALVDAPTTPTMGTSTCKSDCDDGGQQIIVSGSAVPNRNAETDLLAENFYLPSNFKSTLHFKPRQRKFQVDFQFFMALDEWVEGLWFRIYAPVVHTKNDLRFSESGITFNAVTEVPATGVAATAVGSPAPYPAGFFAPAAVPGASLLQSFAAYANGGVPNTIDGIKTNGLQFAKIGGDGCSSHKRTEFGELRFEIGYDFLLDEDYHLGFYIVGAAPTGKRPNGEFLWEAIGTNGKHGELGGGITTHYTFWRSEDEEKHFDFVVEADFTHLFKAKQTRTFDLKNNGGLSRYLLAEKLGTPVTNLFASTPVAATATAPNRQFQAEYAPVANISTIQVKSSFGVQADVMAMFDFTFGGWSWDLGYEFFGGSKEKLKIHDGGDCDSKCGTSTTSTSFPVNTWAVKGLANVFGFDAADGTTPRPLSATDSKATITKSSTVITPAALATPFNAGIDNAQLAQNPAGTALLARSGLTGSTINTSLQPVMISIDDLDLDGARTKPQSHKIFTHINYSWIDREDWVPYVGFGAEVEFGKGGKHRDDDDCKPKTTTTTTSCSSSSSSQNTALTQWGVWIKGGISFS